MVRPRYDESCTIVVEGADARIQGLVPWSVVIDATSYFSPGHQFSPRFRMGQWDGRIKLFRQSKRTFPAGLISDVKEALEYNDIRVQVDDQRQMPALPAVTKDWGDGLVLDGVSFDYPYDFQPEVAEAMLKAQRGIVAVATNGGKTEIACLVTAALRLPTLFMVPGKDLLHQTRARFMKRLKLNERSVGVIGDEKWEPGEWITIGTAQTLVNSLKKKRGVEFLNRVQLVFADECHHVGSDSWWQVLRACNAFFRFGLSGTPLKRTDGADLRLIGATGPVVAEIRNKELIERGISSEVEIRFVRITKPSIPQGTPYPDAYKIGIVENPYRTRRLCKIIEELVDQGLCALVLVKEIPHGVTLSNSLLKYCKFVPNQFVCGKESSQVRQDALTSFKKRDLKVLIATSIFDEGIDMPNIDVLVLAGGGKSSIKTLQRIGRGIRTGGVTNKLIVIDTADFQDKQYLLEHSLQRMQDYKGEDCFEITVVE
jgi:superfamily II DNA or RNA helicase